MVGIAGGGGGGGGGYNYVQDAQPADPSEGEEWYDTGSNAAYVYDGAAWVEQTVVDHTQLSGVGTHDHHSPPTGTNSYSNRKGFLTYVTQSDGGGSNHDVTGTAKVVSDAVRYNWDESDLSGYNVDMYAYDVEGNVIDSHHVSTSGAGQQSHTSYISPQQIDSVRFREDGYVTGSVELREVVVPNHSHNI